MEYKKIIKYFTVGLLMITAGASWFFAVIIYQNNKADILIALDDITREVALPYRMMQMNLLEIDEELPVPVYGVVLEDISDTWGAARDEGRTHEGVDIFAERGTPVFSSTEGYVIRKNIGTRGGTNVMVIGPGGLYYYYAHLDRIATDINRGLYVTTDTVLGFVGNSGNAESTPPHLHFSIYPEQWDAINPYSLLVDRWE